MSARKTSAWVTAIARRNEEGSWSAPVSARSGRAGREVATRGTPSAVRRDVPQLHRTVPAGGGQGAAVGREGDAGGGEAVGVDGGALPAGGQVPQLDRAAVRARQRPAVGGEGQGAHFRELAGQDAHRVARGDRKSTRLNSSHLGISYAVFCLKKKKTNI